MWKQAQSAWDTGWASLYSRSTDAYQVAIEADPTGYLKRVEAFMSELSTARAHLDQIKTSLALIPMDTAFRATVSALERRYQDLAAGLYGDASPVQPEVGVAPLAAGLVVAGVFVSVAGIAWAMGSYEYAVNLREQTALAEQELQARIQASREGRQLQPSTLPVQPTAPTPTAKKRGLGWMIVGGLTVAAGAMFLAKKRSLS